MSMRSYFVNGFGFETSDIKDANILKFIRDHADKCPDFSEDDITVLKTYSNKQINSIARKDPYFLSSLIDEIDEKLAEQSGTPQAYDDLACSYSGLGGTTFDISYCEKALAIWERLHAQYPQERLYAKRIEDEKYNIEKLKTYLSRK